MPRAALAFPVALSHLEAVELNRFGKVGVRCARLGHRRGSGGGGGLEWR